MLHSRRFSVGRKNQSLTYKLTDSIVRVGQFVTSFKRLREEIQREVGLSPTRPDNRATSAG